jgi:hypothetical protein
MKHRRLNLLLVLAGLASGLVAAPTPGRGQPAGPAGDTQRLTGTFGTMWLDPLGGSDEAAEMRFSLATDDGRRFDLSLTEAQRAAAGGLAALTGARVTIEGRSAASQPTRLDVDRVERRDGSAGKGDRGTYGAQPYIWILVRFSDDSSTPEPVSWFETQALGPRPSLDHFWRDVSFNNINLTGSDVVGWFSLPHPRSYYVYDFDPDSPNDEFNAERFLADVIPIVEPHVYFPNFVGIHFCFNGALDGYAWGGRDQLYLDGQTRVIGTTYLPILGWQNQGVVAHEGGHAFGLHHSSGMYGQDYDSYWDTMSHYCGTCVQDDPVYGNLANQVNAYDKDVLGWIHPLHTYILPTTPTVVSLWLNDLAVVPPAGRYLQLQMPFVATPTNFLMVERRRFTGYDVNVAGESVVIHEVVPSRDNPAQVIDIDFDGDPNDETAMWEPGETFSFSSASAAVLVTVEEKDASGSRVTVSNAARIDSYVNLANAGMEDGTSTHPWDTFTEGSGAVYPAGTVHVAPATYAEPITLRKPATYTRWGTTGVVTIGN